MLIEQPEYLASSFCSRDGRLFSWQDTLYRAITEERTPFFEQLFEEGVIDHLVSSGLLVKSVPTKLKLPGYGLVVQHSKIPYVTYPGEWCDQALRDAALFLIDLNLELMKFGLMTHDAHPWNILFEGTSPVFVDLGSIKPVAEVTVDKWVEEYSRFFLRPLGLMALGDVNLTRLSLQHWGFEAGGIPADIYSRLTEENLAEKYQSLKIDQLRVATPNLVRAPYRAIKRLWQTLRPSRMPQHQGSVEKLSGDSVLMGLRNQVLSYDLKKILGWDYYSEMFSFPSFADSTDWSPKQRAVADFLRSTNPDTLIDIGSNRGWYSLLAAFLGANVIALEVDEHLASILYEDAEKRGLSVQPLVLDFLWPPPAYGLLGFRPSAVERLKSEMVFGMALVHHLVFRQALQFDHIVQGFAEFSNRWLLTEFISAKDEHLNLWRREDLEWYTLDNFVRALSQEFHIIGTVQSDPATRTLIMCELK